MARLESGVIEIEPPVPVGRFRGVSGGWGSRALYARIAVRRGKIVAASLHLEGDPPAVTVMRWQHGWGAASRLDRG